MQAGLMEPIMTVEIRIPEIYMGDVNRDLNGRRGRVLGMDTKDGIPDHHRQRAPGRAVHLRHGTSLADRRARHLHGHSRPLRGRAGSTSPTR
jgi:translation elongation factor EF-G